MTGSVDVAIAGAGPAGVAAALACARAGLEVALFDRARFPRDKPCGEGLLPSAVTALARLGLLSRARALALKLDAIGFEIAGGPAASHAFVDAEGAPAYGLGAERRLLDSALVEVARVQPGVTFFEGVEVRRAIVGDHMVIGLETAVGAVRARAVVIADGLSSPLRSQLGLEIRRRRRARLGVRAHFAVRALPFGREVRVIVDGRREYYLTPVAPDLLQVAVLGEAAEFCTGNLSALSLVRHLRQHPRLAQLLDGATPVGRVLGAGPFEQRARRVVVNGALLVGDAAGYVDAITGEGVGLALQTGLAAGESLSAALRSRGAATAEALAPYQSARAAIVRDADRLTRWVLACAERPWLARRAVLALSRRPALFQKLLSVQAGAPFSSVRPVDWARLVTG